MDGELTKENIGECDLVLITIYPEAAVSTLREVFHDEEIFRAGGDEFTMILLDVTEADLARKAEELRLAEKKHGKVSFAIGYHAEQNAADIREALRIADERMYEDKRVYYRNHPGARKR